MNDFTRSVRACFVIALTLVLLNLAAAQPADEPIDFDKARALLQKQRQGQKLTEEEAAYLQRARETRRGQQRGANPRRAPAAPVARPVPAPAPVSSAPPASEPIEMARVEDRVLLPDFRGFTVAEVQQIAASSQLAVRISGSGRAISQDPPPGTVLAVGAASVKVRFEPAAPAGDGREG